MNPSQYRFEHLVTQMKWRLQEGRGEAVYQIGVEDNGLLVGLAEEEMRASLKTLHRMAEKYASSSPPPTSGGTLHTQPASVLIAVLWLGFCLLTFPSSICIQGTVGHSFLLPKLFYQLLRRVLV